MADDRVKNYSSSLSRDQRNESETHKTRLPPKKKGNFVYGLSGLARLFGCSLPTANRIKQSGKIDRAIT